MGHMVGDLAVGTCQIETTRLVMAGSSIHRIREVMDIGTILVFILMGIMVIIVIILIGGVIGDICRMSSRNCDGEMKKSQYAEAWLLGMNKLFRIHDYSENMNVRITTFSPKGKANIW